MSIRSYKNIYEKFSELFPELASKKRTWKGVRFKDHHIILIMNDNSCIHFFYRADNDWEIFRCPTMKKVNIM